MGKSSSAVWWASACLSSLLIAACGSDDKQQAVPDADQDVTPGEGTPGDGTPGDDTAADTTGDAAGTDDDASGDASEDDIPDADRPGDWMRPDSVRGGATCATAARLTFDGENKAYGHGSLASYRNRIDELIEATDYAWRGPEAYFLLELDEGDRIDVVIDDSIDDGWFDSGFYVLTDCDNPVASIVGGADTVTGRMRSVHVPHDGWYVLVVDSYRADSSGDFTIEMTREPKPPQAPEPPPWHELTSVPGGRSCDAPAMLYPDADGVSYGHADLSDGYPSNINERIPITGYSWRGSEAYFGIALTRGDVVQVSVDDSSWGAVFDSGYYVITDCNDPSGSVVAGSDTGTIGAPPFTVPASGNYVLVVDTYTRPGHGRFTLRVEQTHVGDPDGPEPGDPEPADPEPTRNVGRDTCAEIEDDVVLPLFLPQESLLGMTDTLSAFYELTGYDWIGEDAFYRFAGRAGQRLHITVDDTLPLLPGFDSGVYLFTDCADPVGSAFAGADTGWPERTPFEVTLPHDGTYYLAVDSYTRVGDGVYSLRIDIE